MTLFRRIILTLLLAVLPLGVRAQKLSVGVNAMQLANLGTLNAEAGCALGQHWSAVGGFRVNPWRYTTDNPHLVIQNRQQTVYAGVRCWPWYVNSGWWMEGKCQYSHFERSGVWRHAYHVGDALGVGLGGGYTYMLSKHLNLEFGLALWGGWMPGQTLYQCPVCLDVRESGSRAFVELDDVKLSLVYVFGD